MAISRESHTSAEIDRYLAHVVQRGSSKHTIKSYRALLRRYEHHVGPDSPLPTAPRDVKDFLESMRRGTSVRPAAAPSSLNHAYSVIRGFYGFLADTGRIVSNPAAHVAAPAPSTPRQRESMVTISAEQLDQILETALEGWSGDAEYDTRDENRRVEDFLIVALLGKVGLTPTEVILLDQADVAGNSLQVRRRTRGKKRTVTLPPAVRHQFDRYRPPSGYVHLFGNPSDPRKRLGEHVLGQRVPRIARRAGAKGVTPKVLRDTRWTLFLQSDPHRLEEARRLSGLHSNDSLAAYLPKESNRVNGNVAEGIVLDRLHPVVREEVRPQLEAGLPRTAVAAAADSFFGELRNKTGLHGIAEKKLIHQALNVETGLLRVTPDRDGNDNDRSIQEGMHHLSVGLQKLVRNPTSHGSNPPLADELATDYIGLASTLCKLLDSAVVHPPETGSRND
ncbi:MAG: tyrosine recombinase XerD [Thermoleophilia bacterium]|nr:tyrosine recombinase XerD [Thermoleophilia bacterium]